MFILMFVFLNKHIQAVRIPLVIEHAH